MSFRLLRLLHKHTCYHDCMSMTMLVNELAKHIHTSIFSIKCLSVIIYFVSGNVRADSHDTDLLKVIG